jgi:hypothetical protein
MAMTHYGYLMMKILAPNDIITVHTDHTAAVVVVKELYTLVVVTVAEEGEQFLHPNFGWFRLSPPGPASSARSWK